MLDLSRNPRHTNQSTSKTPFGPWMEGVLKSNTRVAEEENETSLCYTDDEMCVVFRRDTWVMRIKRIIMSTLLVQ